jgi:hypothetical protein
MDKQYLDPLIEPDYADIPKAQEERHRELEKTFTKL